MFFKSDSTSGGGVAATGPPAGAPPAPPSALKDALAKRAATLPDQLENNHYESNGTINKLSNSVSVDTSKPPTSAPPPTPAPPVPTTAPPGGTAPLRSTENIIKVRALHYSQQARINSGYQ